MRLIQGGKSRKTLEKVQRNTRLIKRFGKHEKQRNWIAGGEMAAGVKIEEETYKHTKKKKKREKKDHSYTVSMEENHSYHLQSIHITLQSENIPSGEMQQLAAIPQRPCRILPSYCKAEPWASISERQAPANATTVSGGASLAYTLPGAITHREMHAPNLAPWFLLQRNSDACPREEHILTHSSCLSGKYNPNP